MQPKSNPLPTKWYLASCVGALCLAIVLMTVFEIRVGKEPTSIAKGGPDAISPKDLIQSVSHVQVNSVPPQSSQVSETVPPTIPPDLPKKPVDASPSPNPHAPDSQKAESEKHTLQNREPQVREPKNAPVIATPAQERKPRPAPIPSLYSLLITPELLVGAVTVVVIGSLTSLRKFVINRKRGPL